MNLSGSYEQDIGEGTLYRLTENFLRINLVSSNRTACRMAGTPVELGTHYAAVTGDLLF